MSALASPEKCASAKSTASGPVPACHPGRARGRFAHVSRSVLHENHAVRDARTVGRVTGGTSRAHAGRLVFDVVGGKAEVCVSVIVAGGARHLDDAALFKFKESNSVTSRFEIREAP